MTFKEQQELKNIDESIPKLEKQREEILEKLNNETEYDKIAVLSADLEKLSNELENLELRWLELQD